MVKERKETKETKEMLAEIYMYQGTEVAEVGKIVVLKQLGQMK